MYVMLTHHMLASAAWRVLAGQQDGKLLGKFRSWHGLLSGWLHGWARAATGCNLFRDAAA